MATRQYGVTPPISVALPTQKEVEATALLKEELVKQNSFESPQEAANREVVLGRVAALVRKFVHKVMTDRGHSDAAARAAGGKIFTFGSYRLGVHGPGSDIDTLCVVPKHVDRDDFFTYFEPMLREFDGATEVTGVPDAYVPIITCSISGVPIDFLLARLALPVIPDDLELKDDDLLKNLDERCVRSLGGSRVTDQILRLVPDVEVFRLALRCIKFWAQRRAIYSNVTGFLGGVAWAMLVARICQLYPNAAAGAVVSRFFVILYQWTWPAPVLLTKIEEGPLQVRVWNPKVYPSDRSHRMPIITPAYPSMCSTHNVTASTQTVMTQEFKRGHEIVEKILFGKSEWSELWAKHDFFHRYSNYLQVVVSSTDANTQLRWSGKVESQVRQLVMKLEFVEGIQLAHPFVKGVEYQIHCKNETDWEAVTRGHISPAVMAQTLEDISGSEDGRTVHITTFYIGLGIKPRQHSSVPGAGKNRLDLSYPAAEFVKQLKAWENYVDGDMAVVIGHIKSASLPDDVFGPGERREKVPKGTKRPKSKNTELDGIETPSKKRRGDPEFTDISAPVPLPAETKAAIQSAGLETMVVPGAGIEKTAAASITNAKDAAAVLENTSIKSPTPHPMAASRPIVS